MMSSNTKHSVEIRPATKDDMAAVEEMIRELAEYENMPAGPKLTIEDLQRDAFEVKPPLFRCLVAEDARDETEASAHKILGYAIYFNTYSTWEGKAMMLEDLCVRMKNRKQGIGGKLFDAVAKEAVQTGCSRLDFHVLEWNEARNFYEKKGAKNLTKLEDWCFYRLSGNALKNVF